jgi:hypothetical protein
MSRNADTHIRVTEETWQELNRQKGPGDSFNDIINELLDDDSNADGGDERIEVGGDADDDLRHPSEQ